MKKTRQADVPAEPPASPVPSPPQTPPRLYSFATAHGMSSLKLQGFDFGPVASSEAATAVTPEPRKVCILDVLELLCTCGFLRQATRLCVTSKAMAAAAPMGTGKQVYEAASNGEDGQLRVYLEYWRGNRDSPKVLNWSPVGLVVETPVAAAARWNKLACLELLLSFTPAVDVNKSDQTALFWACRLGLAPMVRVLVAAPSIHVNKTSTDQKRTPLHAAADGGHVDVASILVAVKGIWLEAEDDRGRTPRNLASLGGKKDVVAILREAIQKKNELDISGRPIHDAAKAGDAAALGPMVERFIGDYNVLNWEDGGQRGSPISVACKGGRVEAVRLLACTPGVDVNAVDTYGCTPLMTSAIHGNVDIVRCLLTVKGIDINKGAVGDHFKGSTALALRRREFTATH